MTPDTNPDVVLNGIGDYLRREFTDAEIIAHADARSGDVVFHVRQPMGRFRLIVTQRFRDGDGGADAAIAKLSEWNVADAMRRAAGGAIELRTDGVRRTQM